MVTAELARQIGELRAAVDPAVVPGGILSWLGGGAIADGAQKAAPCTQARWEHAYRQLAAGSLKADQLPPLRELTADLVERPQGDWRQEMLRREQLIIGLLRPAVRQRDFEAIRRRASIEAVGGHPPQVKKLSAEVGVARHPVPTLQIGQPHERVLVACFIVRVACPTEVASKGAAAADEEPQQHGTQTARLGASATEPTRFRPGHM